MKKIITFVICMMTFCTFVHAQSYEQLDITQIESGSTLEYCANQVDSIRINQVGNCENNASWLVFDEYIGNVFFEGSADHVTITPEMCSTIEINYSDCNFSRWFIISFFSFENVPEPWTESTKWLTLGQTLELDAYYSPALNYVWQDNSTDWRYFVTGPEKSGMIWVRMYNDCGFVSDTINVYYNTEPATVTVDPNTNKNLVVWEITPEQAEYISYVIINRDGVDMATVPYTDGQYLDNIGSDLAARVYTLTAVCPDGTQCPFPSRRRGTIHMAFLPDINGNVEMTWNQPELGGANIHVGRFEICEYDPDSNEISVIDFVGSVTTSYSCNQSMFDYGYPLIRAIIQDGRNEKDMLSNRTEDLVGLNEMAAGSLYIYPNPSNGAFTIDGSGILHIINVVGQEIMTKEIDGKETIELPKGLYFVQLNGVVQKIVVE